MPSSQLSSSLRRKLLLKVISQQELKPSDVDDIIAMTSAKIVELIEAQSMTFYLVQGNSITFKHVYYSPSLYADDPAAEAQFDDKRDQLLALELPLGTGIVGDSIENTRSVKFSVEDDSGAALFNMAKDTGFEVSSMLTVPLVGSRCVGAVQVLNKEPLAGEVRSFTESDLKTLEEVAEYTAPLIQRLVDPDYSMSDVAIAKYIAQFTGEKLVGPLEDLPLEEKLIEVVGDTIVKQTGVFPVAYLGPNSVSVLMRNPYDYPNRDSFQAATQLTVDEILVAPESMIKALIQQYYKSSEEPEKLADASGDISGLIDVIGEAYGTEVAEISDGGEREEESAPIVMLANRIIEDAYIKGASDIHIEPQEHELLVRYRIDGVCIEALHLPESVTGAVVARLKVMSELDIAERRLPQDGRIVFKKFTNRNIDIDLRVATSPMNFGEKVVMRILDKSKSALPITALGFSEANLTKYRELIQQPYGMILHCGPTGSGKSMTLFSALREIATPDINIQTAEDPIEYTIPGINQMQMKKSIGLDFARALRAYLRMDPDIILVGEIRDKETAAISVEAALTGHLLLSTLHTNDAPSTVARFTDMGVEPFMISSSLLVVCAQRLMRRVCPSCRLKYSPEGNELEVMHRALGSDLAAKEIYRASNSGCPKCGGIGMKGRIGIHELMANSEELTRAINEGKETATLKRIAMASGMKTLHQDAILKVYEGMSTILEAVSTVPPDMISASN